jgi:phage repressor protein C with HTH and peptisase S24 domain
MKIKEIDSHVVYFPRPGEDISGYHAAIVAGNCQEPVIRNGDYIIIDPNGKPEGGDYVVYNYHVYRLDVDNGKPMLKTNYKIQQIDDIRLLDGVIIGINRKLRGEK